ncbi:MAG: VCBS repeat-containing protein [Pirellulaceae bacterium]|jgi:hypothetical protein|nr:VCBS repeat-containing protein [Pirellulaceae bacterium]
MGWQQQIRYFLRICGGAMCLFFLSDDLMAEFSAPVTLSAGRGADGIAIGDVLASGGNELIVANRVSWDILVFQRDQDRPNSLRPVQTIKTAWAPAVIATADINRDSLTDLVIAHYDDYQGAGKTNSFGVCYQNQKGQLGAEVVYRLPRGKSSRAVAVGDIDSDGFAEIVVANEHAGNEVFVWGWKESSSSLQVVANLGSIYGYVVSISVGDVTGDDRNDVVLYGTQMFVLSQSSHNTLSPPVDHGRTGGESCDIGDVNQDGLNDVVGATAFSGEIEIWHQTAGHYLARQEKRACGAYTEDVAIADLNHDGRLDVAVASRDDSALLVFYQQRFGGLGEPCVLTTAGASWLNELAVGDLDGDGQMDLAASHWGSNRALDPAAGFVNVWYSWSAAPVAGDP